MKELWKDIEGYEGLYMVSSEGRVKSLARETNNQYSMQDRILKCKKEKNGYLRVCLHKDKGEKQDYSVHRLVAFAFPEICGEWFKGADCNHKNEDKSDNRAENLEWVSRIDNINYGTGIKRRAENRRNGIGSKVVLQFSLEGIFIREWASTKEVERSLGYNSSYIGRCCRNLIINTAYGYIWRYKEKEVA